MTCVVGIRGQSGVLLAGDSAGTSVGWGKQRGRKDAKTFALSEKVAIACCGSFRLGQVLRYNLTLPELPLGEDEFHWAVTKFIPAARESLKSAGVLKICDGVESLEESGFLLAVRARLFGVESDLQVGEDDCPWMADGSGLDVAAGHLMAKLGNASAPVDDRRLLDLARGALATAAELNAYVAGQVTHVRTKRYTPAERALARSIVEES